MRTLAILFFTLTVVTAQAQGYLKPKARDYLNHSAKIIQHVNEGVPRLEKTERTGKFSRAVAHQRLARNYFELNHYGPAISHSMYARQLAVEVYVINNKNLPVFFNETPAENGLVSYLLPAKELEKSLLKAHPGIVFNDDDYAHFERLERIDVNDIP